jgi:hypothetical protein
MFGRLLGVRLCRWWGVDSYSGCTERKGVVYLSQSILVKCWCIDMGLVSLSLQGSKLSVWSQWLFSSQRCHIESFSHCEMQNSDQPIYSTNKKSARFISLEDIQPL